MLNLQASVSDLCILKRVVTADVETHDARRQAAGFAILGRLPNGIGKLHVFDPSSGHDGICTALCRPSPGLDLFETPSKREVVAAMVQDIGSRHR
jgi:hypothetical protein